MYRTVIKTRNLCYKGLLTFPFVMLTGEICEAEFLVKLVPLVPEMWAHVVEFEQDGKLVLPARQLFNLRKEKFIFSIRMEKCLQSPFWTFHDIQMNANTGDHKVASKYMRQWNLDFACALQTNVSWIGHGLYYFAKQCKEIMSSPSLIATRNIWDGTGFCHP